MTIAVSGADGGHTIDFRLLATKGMILVGRTEACRNGVMRFAPDLVENLKKGDENLLCVLDEADAYVARNGLDLPEEPEARRTAPDVDCVKNPILSLDLAVAGIATIIWATGFTTDYDWLKVDTFDEKGRPRHQRGVSAEPGIYFLGCPGNRAEDPVSSGVYGTTPNISQTRSRSNVTTSLITKRQHADEAKLPAGRYLTHERRGGSDGP